MTRAAAITAGLTNAQLGANTEIVITRNGTGFSNVVAMLDNVEEIKVNTLLTSANNGNGVVDSGATQGDTVVVVGDFTQTSLAYSTIRVEGSTANDTVDISGLTSAHRVVFDANGGTDSFIGGVRPQDVVTGIPGITANDLNHAFGANVESDFQLMELLNHNNVSANNLLDQFTLFQSGHESIGTGLAIHTDIYVSARDLLTGVDTNGLGDHQIAADYALLQL
jgi:hypothetical protein